jgi:hypothetical protein
LPFARIFERVGSNPARREAKESSKAAVAGVVAELQKRISRLLPMV